MNIKLMSKNFAMAASAACLMAGMSVAQATPVTVYLDDGMGNTVTCADGAACDSSTVAGVVSYTGAVGAWNTTVTTGISYPSIGASSQPRLHLNNVSVSGGSGTLTIKASDTGYTAPTGSFDGGWYLSSNLAGSGAFDFYMDTNNVNGSTSGAGVNHLGGISGVNPGVTGSGGAVIGGIVNPFSLTIVAQITHTSGFQVSSFDADIPEPSILGLAGLGMIGLGAVGLRRRRSTGAVAA